MNTTKTYLKAIGGLLAAINSRQYKANSRQVDVGGGYNKRLLGGYWPPTGGYK